MAIESIVSTITKKATGYRVVVRQYGRKIHSRVFKSKREALNEEKLMTAEVMKGRSLAAQYTALPLHKAYDLWFKERIAEGGFKYRVNIASIFRNHVLPFFGNRDARAIRADDVFEFREHLISKELSRITINNVLKSLKRLFTHLIEEERLQANPVKKKHILTNLHKDELIWTREECARFLDFAKRKYQDTHRGVYLMYKIAANCGMRWGEIAALHVDDLDFGHSRIRINKSWCQVGKVIKLPKSGRVRFAALPTNLAQELREYLETDNVGGILFKSHRGSYSSYNTFRNMHWIPDTKAAEVPYTKFHNLRRFYCTMFIQNGGSEATLRKLVGHQDKRMTDLYMSLGSDYSTLAQTVNL